MKKKKLREISQDTGASRRAIQGYEKAGLVAPTAKNKYGHLLYDEAAEQRITDIHFYQQLGFTLQEIVSMIDAPPSKLHRPSIFYPSIPQANRTCFL